LSAAVEQVSPGERLRIAVLGDFDGPHARSWLRWFVARGHDVHAISYYEPREVLPGVALHALRHRARGVPDTLAPSQSAAGGQSRLPAGLMRLVHAARYAKAGMKRVVREIAPDVLHAHYVVEHGFYGLAAARHPYVVTAWGSDVLVEPERDLISKFIARRVVRAADLVTSNNGYMADRVVALGALPERVEVITLGADRYFTERFDDSANVRPPDGDRAPTVLSTRAHEPLYNIDDILDAYAQVARAHPDVRLVIAHAGSLTAELQRRAAASPGRVEFCGFVPEEALRDAMTDAEVFVSVPSSDGTSVALLQAMAAGCFPIVSDLPTQRELIEDGVNGFRVPLHDRRALAERIRRALSDPALRRRAADTNRQIVEARGLNENEMARMERLYLRLAGRG
jgi:glycosyltransferase involved in cell wall biosynthesis